MEDGRWKQLPCNLQPTLRTCKEMEDGRWKMEAQGAEREAKGVRIWFFK